MPEPEYTEKLATFDPDRIYRYSLYRAWDDAQFWDKKVLFVMLNPSTADENVLDPTVRRCLGYAQDWGFKRIEIANIFAIRSTDPKILYALYSPGKDDPVGINNDRAIRQMTASSDLVIAAWGIHGSIIPNGQNMSRGMKVAKDMAYYKDVYCLGTTRSGHPRHPLYLKKSIQPQIFMKKEEVY